MSDYSRNTVEDLLNAASITCGSILSGYLGVKIAVTNVSALDYLNLFATFTWAIFVVLLIYRLSREIASDTSKYWPFELAALPLAIFCLCQNASHVGVDIGVLLCVLAAWSIVPLLAFAFRMFARKNIE